MPNSGSISAWTYSLCQRIGFFIVRVIGWKRALMFNKAMVKMLNQVKKYSIGLLFATALVLVTAGSAFSATYYVRIDGGTATQCTGKADLPYLGSGTLQNCAFNHPFWAHAPEYHPTKMVGGDTLIIDGSNNAEYVM